MRRDAGFLCLGMAVVMASTLASCRRTRDLEITSRTAITGDINGSPLAVSVVAKFNTGGGGTSSCTFTKLPTGFNPGTIGTHA